MNEASINEALVSQLKASLITLKNCIESCPQEEWDKSHNDYPFSQVVFHTLFYCDFYLSKNEDEFKNQEFHIKNRDTFADYEELEYRLAVRLYEREFILRYWDYCIEKAERIISAITLDELLVMKDDNMKRMSKLELIIDTIRHIQHHAAQLGLRLQFITKQEMKWISRG